MSEFSVHKYGGTSASHPEDIVSIYTAEPGHNKVAVLSAIGKDADAQMGHIKITDKLIELEKAVERGDRAGTIDAQEFIIERNRQVYSMLGERSLSHILDDGYRFLRAENNASGYAWIGEYLSARLFAALSGAEYVPSELKFSGGVLQIKETIDAIRHTVLPMIKAGRQIVTEGFFGHDIFSGRIVTLARGGSDTSGVLYTGALASYGNDTDQWINENYTDKDGILSADPDLVPHAHVIPEMTHEEVREKMHGVTERNGVIHGDAIAYASNLGVNIWVRNTFNPDAVGTRIVPTRHSSSMHPVIGVSGKNKLTAIDVYDMGIADAHNYLAKIVTQIGQQDMSISDIPSSDDRLQFILNSTPSEDNLEFVCDFIRSIAISQGLAEVEILRNEGAVYIIGQELSKGLTYTRTLARASQILVEAGLAINNVISHPKSPSLALSIDGEDVNQAICVLHEQLIEATDTAS